MASPLRSMEPEGIPVGNGRVVGLDQRGIAYAIQFGRFEVYALIDGRRTYLVELGQGRTLMCDPAAGGGLIAVAPDGGVLLPVATDSLAPEDFSGKIDDWIVALSEPLGRHGIARPILRSLDPGETVPAGPGQNLCATRGVLWGQSGRTRGLYLGRISTGHAIPVTPATWLCLEAEAEVTMVETRSLAPAMLPEALVQFHALLHQLLSSQARSREKAEAERIEIRDQGTANDVADVLKNHERILDGQSAPPPEDDIVFAYRLVGGELPPGLSASQQPDFPGFADALHLPYRRVALQGRWWRADVGPLIGRVTEDGCTVALIPDWRGRYRMHRRGAKPALVDARLAARLDGSAISVVKPLPERPLRPRDLLFIGIHACSSDLVTLVAATLAASLLGLLVPVATGYIIDTFIPSEMRSQLLILGGMLAVAQVCAFMLKASSDLARQRIDGRVAARIQAGVIDRVLRLPAHVIRRFSSTDLAMRVMSVDGIRRSVTGIALNTLLTGAFGLSTIVLLFRYDAYGACVALALFVLVSALGALAGVKQMDAILKGERMSANVATFTQQIIENISTLRAFGAEKRAYVQWSRNSVETRKRGLRARRVSVQFDTMIAGYELFAMALVFSVLSRESDAMSTGSFLAFASAYAGFLGASMSFGRAMLQVAGIFPMLARVQPLLENVPEASSMAIQPGSISGALEVANVSFAYPGGPPVLSGMSFRVEPGQFVALVGPSGCGKSTLINLMLGVDRPSAGAIFLDGKNLLDLDMTAVRRQIGVCRQNGRLFSGSLYDNILGAHPGTQADVWEAARLAGIEEDIRALPMQLHTVVTEGSATFSGGQIQRLLMARALIGNPRIVVLDEATSALDNVTQEKIVRNVERLGVTRIVVAHRLSTIRNADMILFVDGGRVVEAGSYGELLERGGHFSSFAQRQSL